jgi:hypothetical protein
MVACLGFGHDGLAGMDDRAAELADALERSRRVDGDVGEGGAVAGRARACEAR